MTAPIDRLTAAITDRYRIERELGAGGMATVYLAHDVKHDRDVAIKVLHPDLGAAIGAERFLSEIKTTAKLQHPHILPLLDSGSADGLLFYVMPLVTGETLRARLEREKQLPIEDALRIAREVADALGYAHGLGVIHRDIKPENILLQGGHAVVADFGIALAVQSAGGARMTQTGLSLGTPQYMSPEQAMGERAIDARSDIYALGAVTYEMLTGDPPFTGSTVQSIVAKVLTEKPTAPSAVRDTVPPNVEYVVLRALAKLPADRFATARAFLDALERPGTVVPGESRGVSARTAPRRSYGVIVALSALFFVALATSVGWWRATQRTPTTGAVQFGLILPEGVHLIDDAQPFALSRDGRTVALAASTPGGRGALYMRSIDDATAVLLPGTQGAVQPTFSPDGSWIAFVAEGQLRKVRTSGGEVTTLADVGDTQGLSWGTAGLIFVANDGRMAVAPENGGALRALEGSTSPSGSSERFPIALADGRTVLFTLWGGTVTGARVMRRTLVRAAPTPIGLDSNVAIGVVDGWLVSGVGGGVLTVAPLNGDASAITAPPQQVFAGVLNSLAVPIATVATPFPSRPKVGIIASPGCHQAAGAWPPWSRAVAGTTSGSWIANRESAHGSPATGVGTVVRNGRPTEAA